MVTRRWRWCAAVLAVPALLLLGCSGDGEDASSPTVASLGDSAGSGDGDGSPTGGEPDGEIDEATAEEAQLRYEQCLVDNGVDTDELFGGGGDDSTVEAEIDEADFERFEEAQEECEPILEEVFGDFTLSPEQEAEVRDAEARFAQCMNEQGFDIGTGDSIELPADVDPDEIDAAFEACDDVFEQLNDDLAEEER